MSGAPARWPLALLGVALIAGGAEPLRADLHEHLFMHSSLALYRGEPGDGTLATHPDQRWINTIDLPGLKQAGIRIVVGVVWPPPSLLRSPLSEALRQVAQLHADVSSRPELAWSPDATAVRRMAQLGIAVDLTHASAATVHDALDVLEAEHVPALFSHAGQDWRTDRNLSDEDAVRLVQDGGLIGVGLFRSDLLKPIPASDRWPGFQDRTCDEVVATWLHFARLTRPEAVLLGSDFGSPIERPHPNPTCPHGIRTTDDLADLWAALRAHGIPPAALDNSGERFLALLERIQAPRPP